MTAIRPNRPKLAAMALLALPAVGLLLVAIGEMAGGDITGIQHVPEAVVLVGLMALAWRYPRVAGVALLTIATVLFLLWVTALVAGGVFHPSPTPWWGWVMFAVVLFGFPVLAGWLLLRSSR